MTPSHKSLTFIALRGNSVYIHCLVQITKEIEKIHCFIQPLGVLFRSLEKRISLKMIFTETDLSNLIENLTWLWEVTQFIQFTKEHGRSPLPLSFLKAHVQLYRTRILWNWSSDPILLLFKKRSLEWAKNGWRSMNQITKTSSRWQLFTCVDPLQRKWRTQYDTNSSDADVSFFSH